MILATSRAERSALRTREGNCAPSVHGHDTRCLCADVRGQGQGRNRAVVAATVRVQEEKEEKEDREDREEHRR